MQDDRTPRLDLPMPYPSNKLSDDVLRLRDIATKLDGTVVAAGNTFTAGATLNSVLDQINDGSNIYYWTGDYPKVVPASSSPENTGGIELGAWSIAGDATFRSEVAAATGAKITGYRTSTAYEVLSRLKTYSDYAYELPADGYNVAAFAEMFSDKADDNSLFLPGSLNLTATLFGTSNNAALISILGNNDGNFQNQVVGGDTATLSTYQAEDVLIYAGVSGRAAITTNSPTFTSTAMTITDGADISDLKVGSVIKTSDNYWCKVASISGSIITTAMGWYSSGVEGTPTGTSASLNHIDKTYLGNRVLWIPSGYTGTKALGEEWDFMNAALDPTAGLGYELNGLDMVIHPDSTYGFDTAFLVRSGVAGKAWQTGFTSAGANYASFASKTGTSGLNPTYDMVVGAGSQYGIFFEGVIGSNTKYSQYAQYSPALPVKSYAKNRWGFDQMGGVVYGNATSGTVIDMASKRYYIGNTAAYSLVLPSQNLIAGHTVEFIVAGTAAITVTCITSSVNINGASSFVHTPTQTWTILLAQWDGSQWLIVR